MTEKPCTKCGKKKPLSDFYWRFVGGTVRRESRCQPCLRAYQVAYRQTLRGRLMDRLHVTRYRLRHAETAARHNALERLAALYVAEIARHPREARP